MRELPSLLIFSLAVVSGILAMSVSDWLMIPYLFFAFPCGHVFIAWMSSRQEDGILYTADEYWERHRFEIWDAFRFWYVYWWKSPEKYGEQ